LRRFRRLIPPDHAPVAAVGVRIRIEQSIADTEEPTHQLRKRLGAIDLTVFGVGVVIGTGIFVLTGKAAGVQAPPRPPCSSVLTFLLLLRDRRRKDPSSHARYADLQGSITLPTNGFATEVGITRWSA
jgi:hypothetical protein